MRKVKKRMATTTKILIATLCVILALTIGITFAWFTDHKSYTSKLNFGEIKLKVTDGAGNEMRESEQLVFNFSRPDATKLMPGDTVTMNFKVTLQSTSEPAYYLVLITDTKGVFDTGIYFSNGTAIQTVTDSNKTVGEITSSTTHSFSLSKKISTDYEKQGGSTQVTLDVFAIQQANLDKYNETDTTKSAYHILMKNVELARDGVDLLSVDTMQNVISNFSSLKNFGFYKTSEVPADYAYDETLTSAWDAKQTNENFKDKTKIYKKSATEIAVASDYKLNAPESCSNMFFMNYSLVSLNFSNFNTSKVTDMSSMFGECSSLTNLDVTGFDTSKVTNMSSMFSVCESLTKLDLSNFDTSKVTTMEYMFEECSGLTSLDVSKFNTSNVTTMEYMFDVCSGLTSLDVSNFDTSKVTNMYYMFSSCKKITNLDVSNFNTSKVTNMSGMFHNCSSLTTLDLTNFNTSNVTNSNGTNSMFYNCSALTKLDLSSFDTSKVTNFTNMLKNAFSNNPTASTLIISNKFVINNALATKATLTVTSGKYAVSLNSSVKVMLDGVELTA